MLKAGQALTQLVRRVADQPAPRVEAKAVLGLADRLPGVPDLRVELARLQQPLVRVLARPALGQVGGGPLQHPGHVVGQLVDGIAGRPDVDRRGQEGVDDHPDPGADQGLQHPRPGHTGRPAEGQNEQGAHRDLDPVRAQLQDLADGQGDEHDQADAPPVQPEQVGDAQGQQHPGGHAGHPLEAAGDRLDQGQLGDQERGQRGEHRRLGPGQAQGQLPGDHPSQGRLGRDQAQR